MYSLYQEARKEHKPVDLYRFHAGRHFIYSHATFSTDSLFGGWVSQCGVCTGLSCLITLDNDRTCTAAFTAAPYAKIGATGYSSLNAAYTAAASNATIMLLDTVLAESLTMNKGKALTFKGRYNTIYNGRSGNPTIMNGLLTIGENDSPTVDGLEVKWLSTRNI